MYNKEKLLNLCVNREREQYRFCLGIAAPTEDNTHNSFLCIIDTYFISQRDSYQFTFK